MFSKNMRIILLACFAFGIGLNTFALAQEEGKVIVLSDRVGEVIDLEERNYYYKLFPDVEGFRSAVFLQFPDSTFSVKITYFENKTEKVRFKKISDWDVKRAAEYIDHFEEIEAGTYEFWGIRSKPEEKLDKIYEEPTQQKKRKVGGELELLLGSVGSLGVGFFGAMIGAAVSHEDEGWSPERGLCGYLIGSTLGSCIGVYLIGTSGDNTGSFGMTFLGSILGTGIGIGLMIVVDNLELGFIGFTLAQSVGATTAFNATRKKKVVAQKEALLYFKEGKWNLSYPKIHLKPHPLRQGEWIKTVNLVSLEF